MNATQVHGQAQLDRIELALIALLNAEAQRPNFRVEEHSRGVKHNALGAILTATNRWQALHLPSTPVEPWLMNWDPASDRIFTRDQTLLLEPVPLILGNAAAVAFYMDGTKENLLLRYTAYRRLHRTPKPYVCVTPGTIPYVCEHRDISLDGRELYHQSLHGWHARSNKYVPILAPGESLRQNIAGMTSDERQATLGDRDKMIIVASCIEDTFHRWQVRVSEVTSVWLSTDGEGMKALASLRDDPRTASGRRAPLLHWVREHLRRTQGGNDITSVRRHLRAITAFRLGTVQLEIREPRKAGAPAP
jgi:hypothetical protein